MTPRRFTRKKLPQFLALLCLAGCATVEPPFLNPPLERAVRDKTDKPSILQAAPGAQEDDAPKTTAIYHTPKPPAAARNTSGSTPPAPPLSTGDGTEAVTLNLDNLPLPQFINAVFSSILKLNVSLDPAVATRTEMVSLRTGKPQNAEQIFSAARAVLRSYGLSVNEYNGLVRIVPDSSLSGVLPEIRRGRALPDVPGNVRPVFHLVELEHVNSNQVPNMLRSFFPGNRLQVTEDNPRNTILLSGQSDTVNAALEALQIMDQPRMRGRFSARLAPVFWTVPDMTQRLVDMLTAEGYNVANNPASQAAVLLVPIPAVNSIIVFAPSTEMLHHVLRWAEELDQTQPERGGGYINYMVRNTDAAELAATLREVMGDTVPVTPGAPARTGANRSVIVNKAANSLIIRATPSDYPQWRSLLQELDRPARSALIMATVAEVRLNDSEQFGFQWMLKQFERGGYNVNTGVSARPGDTASVTPGTFRAALATLNGDPRALLTALASNNKIRILSNPSVMARNGEAATIQVGQEVPILTSQISNANTGTATGGTGILQSIQYRSTGVILKVKPVIRAGGRIEIEVAQEVSAAQTNTTGVNTSPVILTRKVDTKLSVSDGNTILLGGLISEQATKGHSGIPFLMDIPYVGALFRTSMSDSSERTELVILLTPYVIEDDFDAHSVTEAFRKQFSWAQPMPAPVLAPSKQNASRPSAEEAAGAGEKDGPASAVVENSPAAPSPASAGAARQEAEPPPAGASAPRAVKTAEPAPGRSRPYDMAAEERNAPSTVPPASSPPAAETVAPLQQPAGSPSVLPSSMEKKTPAVLNSPHATPASPPAGKIVTDEALRRELLQAIQGSAPAKP